MGELLGPDTESLSLSWRLQGRPPFCRDSYAQQKVQFGLGGICASTLPNNASAPRSAQRQDTGTFSGARTAGLTVLAGAHSGGLSCNKGRALTSVTDFKVCSPSVCLSYELVHLYLLL